MRVNPASSHRRALDAAGAASEVIELLEMLWERGRDAAPTAPVSSSQLRVLYVLERDEGINLRTLGELLGAAPSSVSRLCDRLQAVGFVERMPSATSRRELELWLTPHGRSYLRDLRARREETLLSAISALSPTEQRALVAGLSAFRDAVDGGSVSRLRSTGREGAALGPAGADRAGIGDPADPVEREGGEGMARRPGKMVRESPGDAPGNGVGGSASGTEQRLRSGDPTRTEGTRAQRRSPTGGAGLGAGVRAADDASPTAGRRARTA
ncbi:MarR family transcriptional regulator [Streptomyces alkaliphilus]|uniref:MarR family transcriptional regulator n=1 Tax=Streptomyces alkaliphilus TaxID=1472722 RepID=A0A7W3TBQ0_9ACTN|nr:MarR family transcriptional regulator [Streptomyces alkaliphilus]